jgi:hypothetical protein
VPIDSSAVTAALETAREMYTRMCKIFDADRDCWQLGTARDECLDVFAIVLIEAQIVALERFAARAVGTPPELVMRVGAQREIILLRADLKELEARLD